MTTSQPVAARLTPKHGWNIDQHQDGTFTCSRGDVSLRVTVIHDSVHFQDARPGTVNADQYTYLAEQIGEMQNQQMITAAMQEKI
jgi:hypothetical protein